VTGETGNLNAPEIAPLPSPQLSIIRFDPQVLSAGSVSLGELARSTRFARGRYRLLRFGILRSHGVLMQRRQAMKAHARFI